jgi:hypothetical protein
LVPPKVKLDMYDLNRGAKLFNNNQFEAHQSIFLILRSPEIG